MSLAYGADGNLATITEYRLAVAGLQDDATAVTRFDEYDTGINVDGFSLIHNDYFDHLVLLPGVQLQKNNPRRETRTGDGVTYTVDYTYDYDTDGKRPLTKHGDLLITGGTDAGTRVQTSSVFTYYSGVARRPRSGAFLISTSSSPHPLIPSSPHYRRQDVARISSLTIDQPAASL